MVFAHFHDVCKIVWVFRDYHEVGKISWAMLFFMNLAKFNGFCFLDASSHLYNRVCPSVRPSVCWLVTLSSKIREINIFEHIVDRESILGSIDAS